MFFDGNVELGILTESVFFSIRLSADKVGFGRQVDSVFYPSLVLADNVELGISSDFVLSEDAAEGLITCCSCVDVRDDDRVFDLAMFVLVRFFSEAGDETLRLFEADCISVSSFPLASSDFRFDRRFGLVMVVLLKREYER